MWIARTLPLALLLVGGCAHQSATTTHAHAHARGGTSGSSAPRAASSDHAASAEPVVVPASTAVDQSEAPSDVEITRSIRAAVWHDDSLSFTAHNVVIITQDSVVTLRGNVTHEERRSIHAHAFAALGVTRIDDQLVVDP